MTFEDASREEVEFTVRSVISFVRGMICSVIAVGDGSIDQLDGLLARPDLPDAVMEYMTK